MLTQLVIGNFKRLDEVDIPLGETSLFIGPNNSGKTTALQALALWEAGLRKWSEKRAKTSGKRRVGVALNRRDLLSIPTPSAKLLWRDLHVRDVGRDNGKPRARNVLITIRVDGVGRADGVDESRPWSCGLEFDFANEESIYCRPMRLRPDDGQRSEIPRQAVRERIAYLPPMSGLAEREFRKEPGEIGVFIGEGQTAQVLRNLCHRVFSKNDDFESWRRLAKAMADLFGVELLDPVYLKERSEIIVRYREERSGVILDLSSAGRGFQQVLLLLAYLHDNPGTVLLLDEPDAHLEILRQRDIYNLITEVGRERGCPIVAASHSEVILNEAGERDVAWGMLAHTLLISNDFLYVR